MDNFLNNLRCLTEVYSQKDVAQKTGFSASSINNYLSGKSQPSAMFLLKLKEAYKIDIDQFLTTKIDRENFTKSNLSYKKFFGNYIVYYYNSSAYKGKVGSYNYDILTFGVISVIDDKDISSPKGTMACGLFMLTRIDAEKFLKTLDERQYMSGLGEVLKYAFIEGNCCNGDPKSLFEFLSINSSRILSRDLYFLEKLIAICLTYKINVVRADEKEAGLRKVLNLGHTLGHALETHTKYKKYTHGEAVIWGMTLIFKWALKNCYIDTVYYKAAMELIALYGFKPLNENIKTDKIVDLMLLDKKAETGKIKLIVPSGARVVTEKEITNFEEFKLWFAEQ